MDQIRLTPFMVLALALLQMAGWIPARWNSADPAMLEIVAMTPVNCLLLEEPHWSAEFNKRAEARGIATLGVVRPGAGADAARRALARGLSGIVLEGDFEPSTAQAIRDLARESKAVLIELPPRAAIALRSPPPVLGTHQGVWPGIHVQDDGAAKAAPTGAPWIDTNTGFLRFLRAAAGDAPVWIGYRPPAKTVLPPERYLQAICDAALAGARWIIALDPDFEKRLFTREPGALQTWGRMGAFLKYFEDHCEWRGWRAHGGLAMVQDADSGALLSGSVLDMVATRNIPLRAVPRWKLGEEALRGSKMAVSVDPDSLSEGERESLRAFARSGGTLLNGPPGWKFAPAAKEQLTLGKDDYEKLDQIWRGVNSVVGRANLGARLFNVAGMLSNLQESPDGKQVILHLVNYTGYPVENVTAQFTGEFRRARLMTPETPSRELEVYPVEEGCGVDVPEVRVFATLALE